jgi:NAD(P)-dependent dehydrogenase (short-subunit alcohol dehydrogenase family)
MGAVVPERFDDRVALVSGAARGIGRATALALAGAGAAVVATDLDEPELAGTVEEIRRGGGTAIAVTADLAAAGDAARVVDAALERFGRLDVACNVAGIVPPPAALLDLEEEVWQRVLRVDLVGAWFALTEEVRAMRRSGRGGAIVNVSSTIGAHMALPGTAPYAAAKAGLAALTRTAALECVADGVRINAVSPGPVATRTSLLPGETEVGREERLRTALPIGRAAEPAEVAAAVLWLASDAASYAIGHDLVLDGGASV